jgi:hypothetical protein
MYQLFLAVPDGAFYHNRPAPTNRKKKLGNDFGMLTL